MSAMMRLKRLIRVTKDAILPPRCVLCGVEALAHALCADCSALLDENLDACARCAQPLPRSAPMCGDCLETPPSFDAAWAGFVYQPPFDHLVQRLKFAQRLSCARALAPRWVESMRIRRSQVNEPLPQVLLPVPLHRSRLRQRGFNQALELARELKSEFNIPIRADAMRRTRATTPQPGLDIDQRKRNVRGAFEVVAQDLPACVALIDDVMTTGATLSEASKVLKRAGVQRVELWVLARRP